MENNVQELSKKMESSVSEFLKSVGDYETTATLYLHMIDGEFNNGLDGTTENLVNLLLSAMLKDSQLTKVIIDASLVYQEMCRIKERVIHSN